MTEGGDVDYSGLRGQIKIDGSSTVFPISEAVAEEFAKEARTRINVAFSGTGGGFEKFCRGEIDISDASRAMKQSERDGCKANGITDIVELQVGIDALTVVVKPTNTFVKCLTVQNLNMLFRRDGVSRWNQINPEWPADRINYYFPGTDSGTFDYFVETVIKAVDPSSTHRGDGTASEDDNVLAQAIENDFNGIGYFGFAYFEATGDKLRGVGIDGGAGCVEPSFEAALSGRYKPLSRPLYIYTRESLLRTRPEILGFVNFYLENSEALVDEVGYIALPTERLIEQQEKIRPLLLDVVLNSAAATPAD